jgi:hypothetical protein
VKISSKGLALAGVVVIAVAAFVAVTAISMLLNSEHVNALCGTVMPDGGVVFMSSGLLVAGMLVFASIGLLVMAWRSRQRKASTEASTAA